MAATYTNTAWLDVRICGEQVKIEGPAATGALKNLVSAIVRLSNGTSDGSIDKAYFVHESAKAASSTTAYDFHTSLTDAYGQVCSMAEITTIVIRNTRTTALAWIVLFPSAVAPFGRLSGSKGFWVADIAGDLDQGSYIGPGGFRIFHAPIGVPVSNGVADSISVTCSAVAGDTNEWDLLVLGRSA